MSHGHDDFASEPVRGLPERLPADEKILWQGSPDWKSLAGSAFHLRSLIIYASLMVGWRAVSVAYDGGTTMEVLKAAGILAVLIGGALGTLAFLAWMTARDTVYTITDKRVVMRIGIALTLTIQIPFTRIASADVRLYRNGTGNIALHLMRTNRMSLFVLWPHARPWRIAQPEPMFRALPDAAQVAEILSGALAQALAEEKPAPQPAPIAANDIAAPEQRADAPDYAGNRGLAGAAG